MSTMLDNIAPDVDFEKELPEEEVIQEPAEVVLETPEEPQKDDVSRETPEKPQEPERQKVDTVSQKALHEARVKEREWREKAQKIERESQERFQKLEARLNALTNPPPAVPKFEEDPAGHLRHQVLQTKAELSAIKQATQKSHAMQEAAMFEQRIAQTTQSAEMAFSKEHPDYMEAVKHLQSIADKNLEMMGVADPAARAAQIRKDALAMSTKALQMGKSPAEVAYQLAQNYGYRPATQQDPTKKIKALQAGQSSGAAMPSGGSKQSALTLAALEQMDDDEFNKLVDDPSSWSKLIRQMV